MKGVSAEEVLRHILDTLPVPERKGMTGRLLAILSVLAVTGLSALSLGGPVFYFVSWALALMILAIIRPAGRPLSLRFTQRLTAGTLERGDGGS